jgi:hypothetical protein
MNAVNERVTASGEQIVRPGGHNRKIHTEMLFSDRPN